MGKTSLAVAIENEAKQIPTNYSHLIAEKFAMSENKIVPMGRGVKSPHPL